MTFVNTGSISALGTSSSYCGQYGNAEIEIQNSGGSMYFSNSGSISANGQVQLSDSGSCSGGSGSTTIINTGSITSNNDQVQVTSSISGNMSFTNSSGAVI